MASFFGNKPIPTRFNWQENKQRTEWLSGMISTHGQASRVSLAYKAASLWRPWTWSKEPPQDFFCKAIPCSGKEGKYAHREYNILRKLRHEHVVRYEDFGFESPDRSPVVFLYMEYCECGDLSRYVPSPRRAHEKLTAKQARQIIQQISSALVYVHHGLLAPLGLGPETVLEDVASTRWSESQTSTAHRDIKPGNIFIYSKSDDGDLHVKLGDFGLAKDRGEAVSDTYVGTLDYMAPESRHPQKLQSLPVQTTIMSDIWAFGVTMQKITSHLDDKPINNLLKRCCGTCAIENPEDYRVASCCGNCAGVDKNRPSSLQLYMDSFLITSPDLHSIMFLHNRILKDLKCRTLSLAVIKHLLEHGVYRNATDTYGITPMHIAALPGIWSGSQFKELTNILLSNSSTSPPGNKSSLTLPDNYGWTPLHWARASDWTDKSGQVAHLIEMAKEDTIEDVSNTPFNFHATIETTHLEGHENLIFLKAAELGNVGILDRLFDLLCKEDPEVPHKMIARSPQMGAMLHVTAAYHAKTDVLGLLIDKTNRHYINETEHVYGTGLAIRSGHPLLVASYCGHEEVVKQLLDAGAKVNKKERGGLYTSAIIAASSRGHTAIVRLLLRKGAYINERNRDQWTALMFAAKEGHVDVARLLLTQKQLQVDSTDTAGNTALSLAASNGHDEIAQLLVGEGSVNVNQQDSIWRRTPLSIAAERGDDAVVKLLLANGARVDPEDGVTKDTPLVWAAENGHEKVVRLLLAHGADTLQHNSLHGKSPLDVANTNGHMAIVRLMGG